MTQDTTTKPATVIHAAMNDHQPPIFMRILHEDGRFVFNGLTLDYHQNRDTYCVSLPFVFNSNAAELAIGDALRELNAFDISEVLLFAIRKTIVNMIGDYEMPDGRIVLGGFLSKDVADRLLISEFSKEEYFLEW